MYKSYENLQAKPIALRSIASKFRFENPISCRPIASKLRFPVNPIELRPIESKLRFPVKPMLLRPIGSKFRFPVKPIELRPIESKLRLLKPIELRPIESKFRFGAWYSHGSERTEITLPLQISWESILTLCTFSGKTHWTSADRVKVALLIAKCHSTIERKSKIYDLTRTKVTQKRAETIAKICQFKFRLEIFKNWQRYPNRNILHLVELSIKNVETILFSRRTWPQNGILEWKTKSWRRSYLKVSKRLASSCNSASSTASSSAELLTEAARAARTMFPEVRESRVPPPAPDTTKD